MQSEVKQRLIEYLAYLGIGQKAFAESVGLSAGFVNAIRVSIQPKTLEKIVEKYPDLNRSWLLTGEGEMLKPSPVARPEETPPAGDGRHADGASIPLLPISARGGTLNDFVVSVKDYECEKVVSPVRDAELAVYVSGDSMSPEYPNGSQVYVKRINEKAFIEWGRVYMLDTCNGVVIKKIIPSDRENCITCLSINTAPEYAPFDVSLSDVYGIYRVLFCLAMK